MSANPLAASKYDHDRTESKHDLTAVLKPVCMFDGITMDGILDAILSDPT